MDERSCCARFKLWTPWVLLAVLAANSLAPRSDLVQAEVRTLPEREAFLSGGERSELVLKEIAATLKKMETRLEKMDSRLEKIEAVATAKAAAARAPAKSR